MVPVRAHRSAERPEASSRGLADSLGQCRSSTVEPGYWQLGGELRAKVLAKRRKARLGDALIRAKAASIAGFLFLRVTGTFRAFAAPPGLDLVIG